MVRSHIRTCAAAVVAIGLVAGPTGASAETAAPPAVTAESAATLAGTLDAGLRQWFPPTGATTGYQWDGRVQVTASGDHYDVDLPSLGVTNKDGSRLGVGVVRLALTPDADGSLGVGVTLPSRISLLAADGSPDGDLTIGSQHFFGRWLPTLGTFVKVDGSYGDLLAASPKDSSRLAVGGVTVHVDLSEAAAGRWTGPSTLVVNKLDMVDEHGVQVAHLGSAAIEGTVSGLDLAHVILFGSQLAADGAASVAGTEEDAKAGTEEDAKVGKDEDAKAGKDEETKAGPEEKTKAGKKEESKAGKDEETKANWAELHRQLVAFQGLFSGASGKLRVNDLVVTGGADGSTVTVGQLAIHGSVDGLDQEKSTITLGYDHDGVKVAPNPTPQEFLPEKVELRLAAAELPLKLTIQRLIDATASYDEKVMEDVGQQLAHAFIEAGSRLRVEALRIDTPVAAATLEGEARLDHTTALGAVAAFNMAVRGLDVLAKQVQPVPGAKPDEDTQNLLAGLTMVQAMGAPGKDQNGRDIRTYKLQLGADGKVMLNGTDLSAMFQLPQSQGGAAPAPGARATKPAAP
jgi:hypothetical protein